MDDQFYWRIAKQHPSGGYQLCAEALPPALLQENSRSSWSCAHNEGEFHATYEDAIDCPQYRELLGQMT